MVRFEALFLGQAKSRVVYQQGRRRVLKSVPVEDMVECRRHKRGRAQRGLAPSRTRKGCSGDLPQENFDKLVPLNTFWGSEFQSFLLTKMTEIQTV